MTANAIAELTRRQNKEHLERSDAIALQQYIETVKNNLRNYEINQAKNAINKLANDQLNSREMLALAQKAQNDYGNLIAREKERLSNEDIETAKREIERYRAETERLAAESQANLNSNQPQFEKDRNEATVKAGLARALGGLGSVLAAVVSKASAASVAAKTGTDIALGPISTMIAENAAKAGSAKGAGALFKSLLAGAGTASGQKILSLLPGVSYIGGGYAMWKLADALNDTEWAKANVDGYNLRHHNVAAPSNATRVEEEDEIPEEYQNIPEDSPIRVYGLPKNEGGKNEAINKPTQKYEVPGNRDDSSGKITEQTSISPQGGEPASADRSSSVIYSPSVSKSRDTGPGLS